MKRFIQWLFLILALSGLKSCQSPANKLQPVSYADFEEFVLETNYKTDAEKYGWSIVQKDVYSFEKVDSANWRFPDGKNKVSNARLPVTQVSYNDAVAYCQWAKKRLPTYEEYWELVKTDERPVISDNNMPISEIDVVNVVGNVWDITVGKGMDQVRLAGGSLFCSEETCHGTVKERKLYVDKETANVHIGFSVVEGQE
jgi:hypothetical protein